MAFLSSTKGLRYPTSSSCQITFAQSGGHGRTFQQIICLMGLVISSCGRLHTMVLDSKNLVWTFVNWGRPFRLVTPMLDCTSPETTPLQAESGWSFCAILTQSNDVLVFWPTSGEVGNRLTEEEERMNESGDCHAYPTSDHTVPCIPVMLQANPLRIPPIPQLPEINDTGLSPEERSKETVLVKIAAFDNALIGLTNKGHVLKFGDLSNEHSFNRSTRWEYVGYPSSASCSILTYDVVRIFQRTFKGRCAPCFSLKYWSGGSELSADLSCIISFGLWCYFMLTHFLRSQHTLRPSSHIRLDLARLH